MRSGLSLKPLVLPAALVALVGFFVSRPPLSRAQNAPLPAQSTPSPATSATPSPKFIYVANRTQQGVSQLLVYPKGTPNPGVARTITQNLSDVGGLAVDASDNVYVANGNGGNVLQFAPGATSLVQTYL